MPWELTIDGDLAALRWVARGTSEVSPRVVEVETLHRLEWDGLDKLGPELHDEVVAVALQHLSALDGVASVLLCRHSQFHLIDVAFRRPDGGRIVFCSVQDALAISVSVDAELTVTGADGQTKRATTHDPIHRLIALAEIDETVAKVLRLSRSDLQDWPALYRLYEVLLAAEGGPAKLASLGGVTRQQLQSFAATANSPALTGDASRHGVQSGSPPSRAISMPEAVQLLRHLCRSWLLSRVSP
ncbi:hypothetical protein [uncultured Aquimonas sp.]|uniref:hypothetical protein n=1 Tax=uncultured Aquimonas sp. TaxID=385483 RepID=UPI0026229381|nr:hypothetical protein [uncultured Aquimonas sp.]